MRKFGGLGGHSRHGSRQVGGDCHSQYELRKWLGERLSVNQRALWAARPHVDLSLRIGKVTNEMMTGRRQHQWWLCGGLAKARGAGHGSAPLGQ